MTHNLNIQSYSFNEILDLFDLTHNMNIDDLKRAKKTVLMTHPDKSRLPSEYFLFYKKAFEQVVQYFENRQKTNQVIPDTPIEYKVQSSESNGKQIRRTIQEMDVSDFQRQFNHLFEKNMSKRPDSTRNQWFSSEEPAINYNGPANVAGMNQAFEQIKQNSSALSKYSGVNELYAHSCANPFYDDVEDEDPNTYISSDPFGKLKFDDLRKVHKDQTVLAVSERDYDKMAKYQSVDQFMRAQKSVILDPMEKPAAEKWLLEKERMKVERMSQLAHESKMRTMQYEEKNKRVLANFLRLT
jgi:hypothetical protein